MGKARGKRAWPKSCSISASRFGRVFLTVSILAAGALSASAAQIKVMQYNIKQRVGATAGYNSSYAQSIARIVSYFQPDVLTISELEGSDTTGATSNLKLWCNNYISCFANLPDSSYWVSPISDGYSREAIVSRYPIDHRLYYVMSPRELLCGTVELPGSIPVMVYTAHFKADGTSSDASTRQSNANYTQQQITTWSSYISNATTPYLMMGDLNEDELHPQDPITGTYHPITTVKQAYLNDFAPTNGFGSNYTISSSSPNARFDYVLASGQLQARAQSATSVKDNTIVCDTNVWYSHNQLPTGLTVHDSWGSDHLPVVVTFDILTNQQASGIRGLSNGSLVYTTGEVVTASYSDHFYIEDSNRLNGIRVNSTANPAAGSVVEVLGTKSVSSGSEDAVMPTRIYITGTGTIKPLAMSGGSVNGQANNASKVAGYKAPSNGGLLVRVWGSVSSIQSGAFYIKDGSDNGYVRVLSNSSVSVGSFVTVTGVVGFYVPTGQTQPVRCIEPRTAADVQVCQ